MKLSRWAFVTALLCSFGFFKEFKPSEDYLNTYITKPKNESDPGLGISDEDAYNKIYPWSTYSFLIAAFFTFPVTDALLYKPVIVVEGFSYLATRVLLIWGDTIGWQRLAQITYGIAGATEIAYYAYIYTVVPTQYYKRVASYTRTTVLMSRALAGYLAQALYSSHTLNLKQLNYFSLASVSLSVFLSFVVLIVLPNTNNCSCNKSFWKIVSDMWKDFKKFYIQQPMLFKWSLWWAFATCGVLQVGNYVQSLWKYIEELPGNERALENRHLYNGAVEATATICAACAAFVISLLKVNWPLWGELTIALFSLLDAVLLFVAASANTLWLAYICHICYRMSYSFLITIASSQIAFNVDYGNFALIFGFNSFIAVVMQSLLTFIVVDANGPLKLEVKTQFVVYSAYYYFLSLVFMFVGVYVLTRTGWCSSVKNCWLDRARLDRSPHKHSSLRLLLDEDASDRSDDDDDDEVLIGYQQ